MSWTAADVPDQTGRTIVITGANSGIGLEAARELARSGATVIMACRNTDRGAEAARDVRDDVPDADLRVESCNLSNLDSIRAFAARLGDEPIDVLVNNAGVMAIPRSETDDGFETQFGVNHLGHFALTGLVLENLLGEDRGDGNGGSDEDADRGREREREARIVIVSSGMHERGEIDFDDPHGERSYGPWDAYARSKLANVLFAYELERRLLTAGANAESVAVHPGYAATNLQFRGPEQRDQRIRKAIAKALNAVLAQSAAQGALPTLYAATAPEIEGGAYYGPGGFANMRGAPERQASSEQSYDRETARRLWRVSRDLTGVEYDLPRPAIGEASV